MLKEDIIPTEPTSCVLGRAADRAAGVVHGFTVIPFGPSQAVSDMNIGILFMLGVSSLAVLGIVVAGWASNSHYPLIGALRSSAQMVSYELPWTGGGVGSADDQHERQRHGHAEHDRDCAGAAAAGHLVHFQVFPAGLHRVRDICHRHGCRNQPRSL